MPDREHRARWAPVVYGRTRRVDRWWRAVPRDTDGRWLEAQVMGVVAGGRRLIDGPRFLLARGDGQLLVGVACRAQLLSETMHSDGSRELYCFVGWTAPLAGDDHPPALPSLAEEYRAWAGPEYERWMELDWDRPARDLNHPHESESGGAPWDIPVVPRGPVDPEIVRRSVAWPTRDAPLIWEQVRAAAGPVSVSVGWQVASDSFTDDAQGPLHIVADDVDVPTEIQLRPQRTMPAPAPESRDAGYRHAERQKVESHQSRGPGATFKEVGKEFREVGKEVRRLFRRAEPHHDVVDHSNTGYDRDRDDHDRSVPPTPQPTAPGPSHRPPIVPLSHDAERAAKIDADFTFGGPDTPAEQPRRSEPAPRPRPLDPTPVVEKAPPPLGPIAANRAAVTEPVPRDAPALPSPVPRPTETATDMPDAAALTAPDSTVPETADPTAFAAPDQMIPAAADPTVMLAPPTASAARDPAVPEATGPTVPMAPDPTVPEHSRAAAPHAETPEGPTPPPHDEPTPEETEPQPFVGRTVDQRQEERPASGSAGPYDDNAHENLRPTTSEDPPTRGEAVRE